VGTKLSAVERVAQYVAGHDIDPAKLKTNKALRARVARSTGVSEAAINRFNADELKRRAQAFSAQAGDVDPRRPGRGVGDALKLAHPGVDASSAKSLEKRIRVVVKGQFGALFSTRAEAIAGDKAWLARRAVTLAKFAEAESILPWPASEEISSRMFRGDGYIQHDPERVRALEVEIGKLIKSECGKGEFDLFQRAPREYARGGRDGPDGILGELLQKLARIDGENREWGQQTIPDAFRKYRPLRPEQLVARRQHPEIELDPTKIVEGLFKTSDGRVLASKEEALRREAALQEAERISQLLPLPKIGTSRAVKPEEIEAYRAALEAALVRYFGMTAAQFRMEYSYDNTGTEPQYEALVLRFACIDDQNRIWQQPAFAEQARRSLRE
jgi:hypothetical protein